MVEDSFYIGIQIGIVKLKLQRIIIFFITETTKMLISTSNYINPALPPKTTEKINSIKIDFSKLSFTQPTNHQHTPCKHCGGILTQEDRKMPMVEKNGLYQWSCRYCKGQNESLALYFVENNYKLAIEKNIKSKITPPILLFIIDNSGSMYQSIFSNSKFSNKVSQAKKAINPTFYKMLMNSTLYKQEKAYADKLSANYTNIINSKRDSQEQISKIAVLYAVIQHNLKLLSLQEKKQECRVGFIFFSDMLYLLKGARQKQIPVYVQLGDLCHQEWPYQKFTVDFYSYQQLYKAGTTYEKYFGDSRLSNFDVSKVGVSKVKGGGTTALGPALALAMGIISMHDQGSRIIVATDSQPNVGILSVGDSCQIYKKIGGCLQQNGATLSILKWTGDELLKSQQQKSFSEFKSGYRQYVQQIQLNLSKCKENECLQLSILSLRHLIKKQPMGACEVKILCDNPKIMPQKLDLDLADFKTVRFLNTHSKCWFSLTVDTSTLKEYDFLFPVITQSITTYLDISAKQRFLFMSYTKHYLFKQINVQQQIPEELNINESINIHNLQQLCDMELVGLYERRETQNAEEIKTNFQYKDIEVQRDFRGVYDFTFIKNQMDKDQEDQQTF